MKPFTPPEPCECGKGTTRTVLQSAGGYYIGTSCKKCGVPWSRDSVYYGSREIALENLKYNCWTPSQQKEDY